MVPLHGENSLQLFVSYSRKDAIEFADQLVAALTAYGHIPTIDREDIAGAENWQQRLGALILAADTVIFVLSPESARSERCLWEVAEARRVAKRIIPVVCAALSDNDPAPELSSLNYIYFYPEPHAPRSGFGRGLAQLLEALQTDLDWVRSHTRYALRAAEWEDGRRPETRLLSGEDITVAKDWAARRPPFAPEISVLQLAFIHASEEAASRRADERQQQLEERERLVALAEQATREREDVLQQMTQAQLVRQGILAASVVVLAVLSLLILQAIAAEERLTDLRIAYLSTSPETQNKSIALVYVTASTLESYPYSSPTNRRLLADTIRAIDFCNPRAIAVDFIFDRPTTPEDDEALKTSIAHARHPIVMGGIDEDRPSRRSEPSFQRAFIAATQQPSAHLHFGRNNYLIDDFVLRFLPQDGEREDFKESFAQATVKAAGISASFGSMRISWLLGPRDHTETFLTLSAEQVLQRTGGALLPICDMLRNRIVILAGNFADRDQHLTPLSTTNGRRYPGAFVQAQMMAQLIDGRQLREPNLLLSVIYCLVAGMAGFVITRSPLRLQPLVQLSTVLGVVAVGLAAFAFWELIVPFTLIIPAWIIGVGSGMLPSGSLDRLTGSTGFDTPDQAPGLGSRALGQEDGRAT